MIDMMWTVYLLWIGGIGLILVIALVCLRSAHILRLRRVRERKLLSSRESVVNFGVTSVEAEQICRQISERGSLNDISAEQASRSACFRARWTSELYHAVTEECFMDALLRSRHLDLQVAKNNVGPLHGIPITISDELAVAGLQSLVGTYERLEDPPMSADCGAVSALRSAGAVIVCKSTVGTAAVNPHDTCSPLLGTTVNPWNKKLTVGGPGGGGAVLTALNVGAFHVGTDALSGAVSVGVPAFRFSLERCSYVGKRPVPGPPEPLCIMGDNVEVIAKGAAVLTDPLYTALHDPLVLPMPFDQEAFGLRGEALTFAVAGSDVWPFSSPAQHKHPAIVSCKTALLARGHKVMDFVDLGIEAKRLVVLRAALLTAQRLKHVVRTLDPQRHDQFLRALRLWLGMPSVIRWFVGRAVESDTRHQRLAWILHGIQLAMNDANYQKLLERRGTLRATFAALLLNLHIDALIVPTKTPPVRSEHRRATLVEVFADPGSELSILDLPSGVVPIDCVSHLDNSGKTAAANSEGDGNSGDKTANMDIEEGGDHAYSEGAHPSRHLDGVPLCVQVISPPWQDEVCLRAMAEIERGLGRRRIPATAMQNFHSWRSPLPRGGATGSSSRARTIGETTPLVHCAR